jgi:hypothetical protein
VAEHVRPVLLLEMNEIPWRLLDRALGDPRWPHLQAFFASAQTYTTVTPDEGELSPWVTWPSFHRGIPNTEHGIANLGQDVATYRGVPLWQEYRARDLSVGVCGSMQSWPPLEPGPGGFYIPDTFAHDERCVPSYLEPLQRFNLSLVRKNGLVVRDHGLFSEEFWRLLPSRPAAPDHAGARRRAARARARRPLALGAAARLSDAPLLGRLPRPLPARGAACARDLLHQPRRWRDAPLLGSHLSRRFPQP